MTKNLINLSYLYDDNNDKGKPRLKLKRQNWLCNNTRWKVDLGNQNLRPQKTETYMTLHVLLNEHNTKTCFLVVSTYISQILRLNNITADVLFAFIYSWSTARVKLLKYLIP